MKKTTFHKRVYILLLLKQLKLNINMKNVIFLILLIVIADSGFACSCNYGGNFILSAKKSQLSVKAKVVAQYYTTSNGNKYKSYEEIFNSDEFELNDVLNPLNYSIEVEIIDIIKGSVNSQIVEIKSSDGVDCRESLHNLKIDNYYVFNMYSINGTKDYAIGGCSENIVTYNPKENTIRGMIKGKRKRKIKNFDYKKIIRKIC